MIEFALDLATLPRVFVILRFMEINTGQGMPLGGGLELDE